MRDSLLALLIKPKAETAYGMMYLMSKDQDAPANIIVIRKVAPEALPAKTLFLRALPIALSLLKSWLHQLSAFGDWASGTWTFEVHTNDTQASAADSLHIEVGVKKAALRTVVAGLVNGVPTDQMQNQMVHYSVTQNLQSTARWQQWSPYQQIKAKGFIYALIKTSCDGKCLSILHAGEMSKEARGKAMPELIRLIVTRAQTLAATNILKNCSGWQRRLGKQLLNANCAKVSDLGSQLELDAARWCRALFASPGGQITLRG
ncbi:hypothetical protein ACRRTK_018460 [Alexandromys fortis]